MIGTSPSAAALPQFLLALYPWPILMLLWLAANGVAHRRRRRLSRDVPDLLGEAARKFGAGENEDAAQVSARVLALDPRCAQAWLLRGMVRSQRRNYRAALADFNRAIALKPDCALAFYQRAVARHCLDDLDGAIADYDRTMALEPASADRCPGPRRRRSPARR